MRMNIYDMWYRSILPHLAYLAWTERGGILGSGGEPVSCVVIKAT